jgi:glycosyltransferase involved in cell wall biosynthesis
LKAFVPSLKILLVSDSYPPLIGGATRSAQQLARQLTRRGHAVTVATAWQRGLPAEERDGDVQVCRLRGTVSRLPWLSADPVRYTPPPFPDPELVVRLRMLISRGRPDIVHAYGWLTYSCCLAIANTRVPLLLAARDYGYVCPLRTLIRRGEVCSGPALRKCLDCAGDFYGAPKSIAAVVGVRTGRWMLRRKTTWIHSTSTYTDAVMRQHLTTGLSTPHSVIPDFREDELTGPPNTTILERLPPQPYILFVGSFRKIKGVEILLDAYKRLRDPPPLVMIGARSMDPIPTMPSGVTALFDVPHDTVMAAWERALFGVAPSIVPETLGNVVHEGMSRGKAMIGTTPGGHADMIEHGQNGLLVRGGDPRALASAMARLIEDISLRTRMEHAAVRTASQYTDCAVVPEFESLYRKVIAAARHKC